MVRQLLSLFIISLSFFGTVSVQAAGSVTVTRGQSQNINWSVAGVAGCNPVYEGTGYPSPPFTTDSVDSNWTSTVKANTDSQTLTFHGRTGSAFPQTYVFKCTAVGSPSVFDTATVTINDCTGGTSWDGSACIAEPVPPNPTGLTLTSNTNGTSVTANWTAPGGYTNFKTRARNDTTVTDLGAPGWNEDFAGTSITFPTTPGQTYSFWLHTISGSGLQISTGVGTNVVARNPTASFTATPSCTIPTDQSGCNTTLSWTSSDSNNGVTLTDCGLGVYTSRANGAQTGQVWVPYNAGCYRIYNGQYADNATLAAAIAGGQTQLLAQTSPLVASSCANANAVEVSGTCTLPTGSLSPDPATCDIAADANSCTLNLSWTTTNAPSPNLTKSAPPTSVSTLASSAGTSFTIQYGTPTTNLFSIKNGSTFGGYIMDSLTAEGRCATATTWDGSFCRHDNVTITASAGANGSISPTGAVSVAYGTDRMFTITPNSEYSIASVLVDGSPLSSLSTAPFTYTFPNVVANGHTIEATFTQPTGTMSTGASCRIDTGDATCNQAFNITTSNPYGLSQVVASGGLGPNSLQDIPSGATSRTLALPYGTKTYYLYNNARQLAQVGPIVTSCRDNNGWDSDSGSCVVDPQVISAVITGNYYMPTGTLTIRCSDSNRYRIIKVSNGSVFASGNYVADPTVITGLNETGDYQVICLLGNYPTPTPLTRTYNGPPPDPEIVSLTATPRTINKDESTTIAWEIKYPSNNCSLTAKVVCAGGVCSQAQAASEIVLRDKLLSESTDSNDPHTSRSISSAVKALAPGEQDTTWRGFGKKTFKVSYTTDFTLSCGTKSETKRIQISKSTEQ
jgi:hypothetical protein